MMIGMSACSAVATPTVVAGPPRQLDDAGPQAQALLDVVGAGQRDPGDHEVHDTTFGEPHAHHHHDAPGEGRRGGHDHAPHVAAPLERG